MFVTVPVGLDAVVPPMPAGELLLDELLPEDRARLPITLKVTVNGSLFGLLNFKVRAADVSPADNRLSRPTLLLKSQLAPTPVPLLSALLTFTLPEAEVSWATSARKGVKIV